MQTGPSQSSARSWETPVVSSVYRGPESAAAVAAPSGPPVVCCGDFDRHAAMLLSSGPPVGRGTVPPVLIDEAIRLSLGPVLGARADRGSDTGLVGTAVGAQRRLPALQGSLEG
jgi:hypothetical protein